MIATLAPVKESYTALVVSLLDLAVQQGRNGFTTITAERQFHWDSDITTVISMRPIASTGYQFEISFKHTGDNPYNFFTRCPELRDSLRDELNAARWEMEQGYALLENGLRFTARQY